LAQMGPGQLDFSKIWMIVVITMSARTADSALRARRPRAVGHGYFMIRNRKSVDTFYTSVKVPLTGLTAKHLDDLYGALKAVDKSPRTIRNHQRHHFGSAPPGRPLGLGKRECR